MDKFGLSPKTLEQIITLLKDFSEIQEVRIFGSRAKGNYNASSDIDLAIFGQLNDKTLRHISSELDELPTPYKFDLVDYSKIDNSDLNLSIDNFGIKIL